MEGDATFFITYVFMGVFLCLSPALVAARFIWRGPPWWVIIPVAVLAGWFAYAAAVLSYFAELQDLVANTRNPDPDLVDHAMADGGPMVFAALFGWVFAGVYFLIWWFVFSVAKDLRRLVR